MFKNYIIIGLLVIVFFGIDKGYFKLYEISLTLMGRLCFAYQAAEDEHRAAAFFILSVNGNFHA